MEGEPSDSYYSVKSGRFIRSVKAAPLFERITDMNLDTTFLEKLYAFSQNTSTPADISFEEAVPVELQGTIPTPMLTFRGFRRIVSHALLKYIDMSSTVIITPKIKMLTRSFLYRRGNNNTTITKTPNNSFYGIINQGRFQEAYHAQTRRQENINRTMNYSEVQRGIVDRLQETRTRKYRNMDVIAGLDDAIVASGNAPNTFSYYLFNYGLFTEESRSNFILATKELIDLPNIEIIIIPFSVMPFEYNNDEDLGHAEYILINKPQKMYTIIDGQFDISEDTRVRIRKQLMAIDPFIQEIVAPEQYEPYLYSVKCPQAVVLDKNCIWWSMLIVFLFLKANPRDANYASILLALNNAIQKRNGEYDPVFIAHLMNSFKGFVLKDVLAPMLDSGVIVWPNLDEFFQKNMPSLSPSSVNRVRARKGEPATPAAPLATATGPAVIIQPRTTIGGRRKKLTSKARSVKRTRNYGKYTRKSYRR
jgi:hypothetical protein